MPDIVVKIYLWVLIGSSVLWFFLFGVIWSFRRDRPSQALKATLLWRNLFFLISGILSLYFFVTRLMNNSLILVAAFIMLVGSTYAAELIEKSRVKNAEDRRAT